jgi:hypothetical protein
LLISMENGENLSLEQIQAFLTGNEDIEFKAPNRKICMSGRSRRCARRAIAVCTGAAKVYAALPAEVVKQLDHPVLSRGEASASLPDFGAKRECGLGRRCQTPYRDLIEADRRGQNSVARCTEGWRGYANTPPFSSGKRVFIAEEILHRSPDSMPRVGSEFQATGCRGGRQLHLALGNGPKSAGFPDP